uniref:DUF4216 domain-containing protein n=1 Tax=Brassica oleracea TaxID=3712 RepID=A0A3P6EZE4_BRAOL|nr:unnamed protein product [Brassica oleracea]
MINEETSNFAEYYFLAEVRTKNRRLLRHDDRGLTGNISCYGSGHFPEALDDLARKPKDRRPSKAENLIICKHICSPITKMFFNMRSETFDDWILEMVVGPKFYPRVRNRDDPWVIVTRLNPRGRVQRSSELEDPLQPSTSGNLRAAEDLAGVGLVVDLTDFGEEAVVHVEDEPVIGEFHQDPDSDSSGDDDSETD